jgi:hypothetical protein
MGENGDRAKAGGLGGSVSFRDRWDEVEVGSLEKNRAARPRTKRV